MAMTPTDDRDEVIASQRAALEAAWVALIPLLDHAHLSCNEGMEQKCFTCTALTKIGVVTGRLG